MKKASRILYNGTVLTMDPKNTVASAIAIAGDRILATGSMEELSSVQDESTEVSDLQGKTLMPGFYDAHGHFLTYAETFSFAADLNSPPIGDCVNFDDMRKRLREFAEKTPPGDWVVAFGFDDTIIAEKRFPTRHELDAVTTRHPILIFHISMHLAALNTLALQISGITKETEAPEGSIIRREADGEPDGVLEEGVVTQMVVPKLTLQTMENKVKAYESLSRFYAARGTTTAVEASVYRKEDLQALVEAVRLKRLSTRVLYNPMWMVAENLDALRADSPMLTRGGVKILQDGSIQGFTAYLSSPYHTPFGGDPDYRGYPIQSREKLYNILLPFHKNGRQCLIHTNGDAASEDVVTVIEKLQQEYPQKDIRHLIVHAQNLSEDHLKRMEGLSLYPSFFAIHLYYWGDRHNGIFLGPERTARMNPMRSAIDRGLTSTSHCDAPIVPLTPFLSISSCVNRRSHSGTVYGEDQCISVTEALRAHTINPAFQNHEDHLKGSLEPGKYADMIVLDANPLKINPDELPNIQVLETILGGETVYRQSATPL